MVDFWAAEGLLLGHYDSLRQEASIYLEWLRTLYIGPFMAADEAPWAMGLRERLLGRLGQVADKLLATGQNNLAGQLFKLALGVEPLQEVYYRGLMQSHIDRGNVLKQSQCINGAVQYLLSR